MTLDPGFRLILPTGLQAAGARIRELRNGVMLGDLTITELVDEGRAMQRWHQHVGGVKKNGF